MDDDKTQPIVSATPVPGPTPAPTAGTPAPSWDLPANNIAPNGLPEGKTDTPAATNPDFSYSTKDDAFSDDSASDSLIVGDDQKSLADKMVKNLEAEEKKPYSEESPKMQSDTSPASSSGSLADLEKKLSDQKSSIDDEIKKLQDKKVKLNDILDKISAFKKEEDDLTSQAQDVLK